jgi:hypothetical protein
MSDLPRCPKCRKQTYTLSVVYEESADAEVVDGVIKFRGTAALPEPVRAYGTCQCGYQWKIRNANTAVLNNED